MRIVILYNPVSGRGCARNRSTAIADEFRKSSINPELIPTQAEDPKKWLKPKLEVTPDAVVVVGGDGTLRQVASVLVGSHIPVYHAGSGTENLFAKSMNTNNGSPASIVDSIMKCNSIEIDTARANGKFMLLMASVGYDAAVVTDLANRRGSSITHLSYLVPCVRQIFKWNPPCATIVVDGKEVVANQIGWAVVANSKYYARGLNPARNANISDGKLDVVFFPLKGRLSLFKWIRLMKRGTHLQHSEVFYTTGKQIIISTEETSPWQFDGDALGNATEMDIVCQPKSLRVII